MTNGLGQFRADLVHEGFDILWHRGFPFPLVELIETTLLTLQNMAVNAVSRGLRIGRLQRTDQVQMIAVDLLQIGDIVTSPAGCENADQLSDSGQSLEASLVPCKLHDVGVKRQIGYLETFHLFFVQDRLKAGGQFLDQCGESRSDGAKVANLSGRRRACGDRARGQTFQCFPQFKQLPDVVPVESDHDNAASGNRFQESLTDQLADRFTGGRAADAQFLGNGHVRNGFSRAQLAGRDLALDVVVSHFAPGSGSLGCFGHGFL
jgi:hypothetical protein